MEAGEADYEIMTEKNGIIINDPEKLFRKYYGYTPKIGDVLRCNGYGGQNVDMQVLGIAKNGIKTGVSCLILSTDNTLSKLYPEIKNFTTTWNLYTDKDTLQLRKSIFTTVEDGRIDITSRKDLADSLKIHTRDFLKAAYVLAAFLFIFALVNLINTLMTNLFAKKQELAILQSVGMSSKQTASMLAFECLWYVVIALIVTIAIGGPAGMMICYIFNQVGIFGTLTYHFPWMALAIFAAVLMIIQFCYSVAAVSYIQKETLTDRIKVIE
jgi:putative ABC transport system permease protein